MSTAQKPAATLEPREGSTLWLSHADAVVENDEHRVIFGCMPEEMVKFQNSYSMDDEYVDYVAGYMVLDAKASTHDGVPATTLTLYDSMGGRAVGILRLRNDANRDAFLHVWRYYVGAEDAEPFRESLRTRPANLPSGFEQVEARTINPGDEVFVEAADDPDDEDAARIMPDEVLIVEKVSFHPSASDKEKVEVFLEWAGDQFRDFNYYAPESKVWAKRKAS